MAEYTVLTNRKRALIALAHSLVFWGIALHGFFSPRSALALRAPGAVSGMILVAIYVVVAAVLTWLATISRHTTERLYFALCASSASFGLLRTIFGDIVLPAAQYLRVAMLTSAVLVGTWILRFFSHAVAGDIAT